MCEKAKGGQSHTAHRVVAFEPYAPAALFLRIALTLLVIKGEQLRLTFTPVRQPSNLSSASPARAFHAWQAFVCQAGQCELIGPPRRPCCFYLPLLHMHVPRDCSIVHRINWYAIGDSQALQSVILKTALPVGCAT